MCIPHHISFAASLAGMIAHEPIGAELDDNGKRADGLTVAVFSQLAIKHR